MTDTAPINYEIKPLDESTWPAFAALVERHNGIFGGDEAIAWAEWGTVEELPNIHHRKQWEAETTQPPDYRVTCIFVDKRYRKGGLAEVALRGAVDLIARQGGGTVEGYPHDIPEGKKMSASFVYNGTRQMYERVGFTFERTKGQFNTVMRREVAPAG